MGKGNADIRGTRFRQAVMGAGIQMSYIQLIEYMKLYRKGLMQKSEMTFAIMLWQESIKDYNHGAA